MTKNFFYPTIVAGMLFISVTTRAQQARQTDASPKPPEMKGKALQADKDAIQPVVSPANAEKPVPTTTGLKSSEVSLKPIKGNEPEQAKANQTNAKPASVVPARTDNLVVPKDRQKLIPESNSSAVPAKINQ